MIQFIVFSFELTVRLQLAENSVVVGASGRLHFVDRVEHINGAVVVSDDD
jgi:hypothetical protein